MYRFIISLSLFFLAACGGTSVETSLETPETPDQPFGEPETPKPPADPVIDVGTPETPTEPVVVTEPAIIPITFVAGAFDSGFSELGFVERQQWADEGFAVVDILGVVNPDTAQANGTATYNGLMQLDYDAYVDGFGSETYLAARAMGKMALTIDFFAFSNNINAIFSGTADSFVLDDDTPLVGKFQFDGGQSLFNANGSLTEQEILVVAMDGTLNDGSTQYSGNANMRLGIFGAEANYLSGTVSGQSQISNIATPTVGTLSADLTGSVVANRN